MSYCRFGPASDVYLYPAHNGIVCCACRLNDGESIHGMNRVDALEHLAAHELHGDSVPKHATERLRREVQEGRQRALRAIKKRKLRNSA